MKKMTFDDITLVELDKMEQVRNFLISENIADEDSFEDYLREL